MTTKRFQFTVDHTIGRQEVELVVTYSVTPFVEATYWQPAEGGEVERDTIRRVVVELRKRDKWGPCQPADIADAIEAGAWNL